MGEKRIITTNGVVLTTRELEEYLEKIGAAHNLVAESNKETYPISRLQENYIIIKEVYELLNEHVKQGISVHPAGEWILDNFYIIEETVKSIKQELTMKKYKNFVGIKNGIYDGFARVYILASEIVNYTDNKIEQDSLEKCLSAYQRKKTLNMDEIWNIGVFLQIAIIENIRQICESIYVSQIQKYKVERIIEKEIENSQNSKFRNFRINRNFKRIASMKYSFIEYMSYKLKKYGKKTEKYLEILEEVVEKTGTTVSEVIKREHFDIAVKRVSIGNCITSIKKIQRINFLEIFEKINGVEEILKQDPANVYDKMDYKTKDLYRQAIKEISRKSKISEIYIARKLLEICKNEKGKKSHIGYYLFGNNKSIIYDEIGFKTKKIMSRENKTKYYISMIAILTVLISFLIIFKIIKETYFIYSCISFLILLIPVSEFVIQIIQYILSKFVKPKPLPRMDLYNGIDEENRTMVVIPTIVKSREKVKELMKKMEVFYLANKSDNLYFCLLGDCTESNKKDEKFDKEIIDEGLKQVEILNKKYDKEIFNFAYRKRKWNDKQSSYLGWERKRGALTEFVECLRGKVNDREVKEKYLINTLYKNYNSENSTKIDKGPFFLWPEYKTIKYLITLDSDTDLVLNSAFELIGAMAHVLNKPEIKDGKVIDGYGLIQPRVGVNIDVSYKNEFTKIFAGSGGIDSYTNAISDIYQDNFGEGIFTGKGIFDLEVFSKMLKNEIPENIVLSHDLLEGCYLRCGLASDITIMDGYPTKYLSFMSRLSRWIRGDWQIISWLNNKKINLLSKFKIFDNLRRSLFEIFTIISIVYFYALGKIWGISVNGIIGFLVITAVLPFLLEIANIIIFKKEGEHKQDTFTPKISGILGAIYRSFLIFGCIPFKAYISLKSIITSIFRMYFSKKNLLEWTTSEEAEKKSKDDMFSYYKNMFINVIAGIVEIISGFYFFEFIKILAGMIFLVIPYIMCKISRNTKRSRKQLNETQKEYILDVAKNTFSFFKDNITKENNFLIPDNYQEDRKQKYIERTSSTNIGLSILAVISGIDLCFISKEEGLNILKNIVETIDSLEKWNGHLYNWYNIKTKEALNPKYISTVDSGNLVGYLYVLKAYLEENQSDYENIMQGEENEKVKVEDMQILRDTVSKLIENTDFSKLYSPSHRLFSIGFNVEENRLTDSYYDLLASEARQASIVAIAKKDVPSKHWNNMSRTLTILNNKKGLISWSGTAFEYLMPNINIPRYEGSLLDESCKFAIMSQMEYAKKLNIPWGISEAAFNVKDLHSNYQYKAFGIPWLGLKRGLADEIVIATYSSVLAIEDKPQEVYRNLKLLEQYGMYDKYGFFESLDLTPSRLKRGEDSYVVATYMAHHQALILLSINNLLKDNIFQKRFMQNPEIEAVSILLQERMPETFIVTKEEKEMPQRLKYQDYENYAEITYKKVNEDLVRSNVISNENYISCINQKGQGFSKYKDIYINRFKATDDYNQGIFFYVKNIKTKKIWTNSTENTITTFTPDQSKMERVDDNIKTTLKITLDSEEPVEIRRLTLENMGEQEETLEVSNVFEPVLSTKDQDYSHPAFNNLFLKYNYDEEENVLKVRRRKRGKDEKETSLLVKFSTEGEVIVDNEFEISNEKLNERGNLGIPTSIVNSTPFSNKCGLVIEPIVAMKKTIKIKPNEKIDLDFLISVHEDITKAYENLKKYNNSENIKRAFEISKAKTDAENRYLRVKGKDIILYQKILSYIIFNNPLKALKMKKISNRVYEQAKLWKYGISGDIPIILVKIKDINDIYMVTSILKMYEFIKTKNIDIDIVFLDEENYSYENYVHAEINEKIADKHLEYMKNVNGGIFVLSKNEIDKEDIDLLNFVSELVIDSHKGDLEHVINDMEEEYLASLQKIENRIFEKIDTDNSSQIDIFKDKENLKYYNEYGAFSADGKEYFISINKNNRTPTVWSHILTNEKFGTVITENMGGYSWYRNSRLNRITSWHNKAFLDIPSEIIYLQDEETGKTWSLGLNPMPDDNQYNIIYGFGYAKYTHNSDQLNQELDVFIPNEDAVKIGILKLNNTSAIKKKIRIVYYLKPVFGEDEIKTNGYLKLEFNRNANLIEAQNLYKNDFKHYVFVSSSEKINTYTGNNKFFLGKGGISNPDALKKYRLNNEDSIGRNGCIAIELEVEIEAMSIKELALIFGAEDTIVDLKNIAYKYNKISNCKEELENVKRKWKDLLEKMQVYTPIESMNIMLNGWTLYQTYASRILGKTGFYQSGGAYGYRDQLQDCLAFKYIDSNIMKKQILKHSQHQFLEGDVEHWWHEETGRGIRTRFSDDLVWLPFTVEQYVETTGDVNFLKIETSYLDGNVLNEYEEEKYDLYKESNIKENIYLHCKRAIEKAINLGEHGLPKIGIGDWNDGMSTVGNKGKGESIWLGFFLYIVLKKFVPLCDIMNDENMSLYCNEMSEKLRKNLNKYGWDGRWFKRAYTDDGDVLGSIENEECRIDSIAQSWSVISGAGDNDKKFISMESLENHLVDKENGIIKLLDPPFENGKLKPGYIKAYLPGVRENGGQYTHAAIWAIIAETILGFGDKGTELYRMINPIEHSRTREAANKYKAEPFVMPADVYGFGNLAGRGGWTWYTGSSSWFYVTGIEYILGIKINDGVLSFNPCIPKSWKEFNCKYRFGESIYNIKVLNPDEKNIGVRKVLLNGEKIENTILLDNTGKIFNVEVTL